jgi:hypothetical protein|tara:strand:- start:6560 stop:6733 length:174 start_codon:yes stop_codon:yes gene_type:complete
MKQRIENDANGTIQSFASDSDFINCEDNKAGFLSCTGCYKLQKGNSKFQIPSCPTTG